MTDASTGPAPVGGTCDERFEAVRTAFADNFAERGELGAAVCVIVDGEAVVDLVGGWTDETRTRAWSADTITDFYSVGKALLSLLVLRLVDDGTVGLDDPVSSVWPEFAAAGKGDVTIRHALTHRAGVPAIRRNLTDEDLFDWDVMTGALAATGPWWPAGEQVAYHVNTFGHLVGELVRRISGTMPGDALRSVAGPLGADVFFGVPVDEQHRCAETVWDPSFTVPPFELDRLDGLALLNALAHFNPPGYSSVGVMNTTRWRSLQLGSQVVTARHVVSRPSTPRCSRMTGCCPGRCSSRRPGPRRPGTARSSTTTSRSVWASSRRRTVALSGRTRERSDISAPVDRSGSRTPSAAWRSAT